MRSLSLTHTHILSLSHMRTLSLTHTYSVAESDANIPHSPIHLPTQGRPTYSGAQQAALPYPLLISSHTPSPRFYAHSLHVPCTRWVGEGISISPRKVTAKPTSPTDPARFLSSISPVKVHRMLCHSPFSPHPPSLSNPPPFSLRALAIVLVLAVTSLDLSKTQGCC